MRSIYEGTKVFAIPIVILILYYLFISDFRLDENDVSNSEEYIGKLKLGGTYLTKKTLFIVEVEDRNSILAVTPEGRYDAVDRYYSAPYSLSSYTGTKTNYSDSFVSGRLYHLDTKVIGILNRGANILCCKLILLKSWDVWWGSTEQLHVFGKIIINGKNEWVELRDVFHTLTFNENLGLRTYRINGDLIKLKPESK